MIWIELKAGIFKVTFNVNVLEVVWVIVSNDHDIPLSNEIVDAGELFGT